MPDTPKEDNFVSKEDHDKLKAEADKVASLTQKLTEHTQTIEQDNEALRQQLSAFGNVTPAQIKELQEKAREAQLKAASESPEEIQSLLEKNEQAVRSELGETVATLESRLAAAEANLKRVTITRNVMNDFASDVEDSMRDIVESHISKHIHQDKTTGQIQVRDDNGKLMYSKENPTLPMQPEEFLNQLRTERPPCFKQKGVQTPALESGQMISPSSTGNKNIDGINVDKFMNDAAYREKLSPEIRAAMYVKLGV
jgi:hypothetical protein